MMGKRGAKFHTLDTRKKMSASAKKSTNNGRFKKGHVPWMKGKKGVFVSPWKGVKKPFMVGNKYASYKHSPEQIRNELRRNPKSSLELKFEKIVTELRLPYKFVGNGEFLVGRKCPDFVNTNGQKIAVDVYYRKHKEEFRGGLENWKSEREKIFVDYGWKLVLLDETKVNLENIEKIHKEGFL